MSTIKRFKVDEKGLSLKEKALFKKLIKAAELISPLYLKQKNDKYAGANFYPHDATPEEIKKAAEKDPQILSPYTFVERGRFGELFSVPYHIKFNRELQAVSRTLKEAVALSENKSLSLYLESVSRSLLDGNYEKSEIIWLTTETFKFGFVIGPIERYLDKLFFVKCAYEAWAGILDEKKTKKVDRLKRLLLAGRRKILPGVERVNVSKLGIRVDKTAIFSGLIADFGFTGTNLPNNIDLMEKYGSNLTIFDTSLDLKFKKKHLPIFRKVFNKEIQKNYSTGELYEGSLRCIALHEISHSLIRYRDAEKRLKDLFPIYDEILAYILGIKFCGTLLLKGALTQKELEAVLIMHICRNFMWWMDYSKNPDVYPYVVGSAMAHNFFLKEGGLKEKNGIFWPDFAKILICIDELSHFLEYYLAQGNYSEAKKFVLEYGSLDLFQKFFPRGKGKLKFLKDILKKTGRFA